MNFFHLRKVSICVEKAAIGQETTAQELNCIFKSLGERGKEGEKWKKHNDIVVFYILRQLSALLKTNSENRIMFRPYGSAVEDLKSVEPNDVGDVDIMIFPNSHNLLIHDEMMEYSENPLHVRIKEENHSVLQSCLVEDSEYVATSALKNFHPAIYQPTSPAITLTFETPRNSTSEQLEGLKVPRDMPVINTAEWEWLVHLLYSEMGIPYTREHAEVLDNVTTFMNELGMILDRKGLRSPSEMIPVAQELYWSDRGKMLRAQMSDVNVRSQNESQR